MRLRPYGLYDPRCEHDSCGIGAVVNTSGRPEHRIIDFGKQVLLNLHHRGAAGSDGVTGDGAGILMQLPHAFLAAEAAAAGFGLPDAGHYGVGMVFGPRDKRLTLYGLGRSPSGLVYKLDGMDYLGKGDGKSVTYGVSGGRHAISVDPK